MLVTTEPCHPRWHVCTHTCTSAHMHTGTHTHVRAHTHARTHGSAGLKVTSTRFLKKGPATSRRSGTHRCGESRARLSPSTHGHTPSVWVQSPFDPLPLKVKSGPQTTRLVACAPSDITKSPITTPTSLTTCSHSRGEGATWTPAPGSTWWDSWCHLCFLLRPSPCWCDASPPS